MKPTNLFPDFLSPRSLVTSQKTEVRNIKRTRPPRRSHWCQFAPIVSAAVPKAPFVTASYLEETRRGRRRLHAALRSCRRNQKRISFWIPLTESSKLGEAAGGGTFSITSVAAETTREFRSFWSAREVLKHTEKNPMRWLTRDAMVSPYRILVLVGLWTTITATGTNFCCLFDFRT